MIPVEQWKWFGSAGHLIVGSSCRFHLCTEVGDYFISTVGEYWPERVVREIHAKYHDPAWLASNGHLKGDTFDAAYFERFGYEDIGCERKYETMVFKVGSHCDAGDCNCGMPRPYDWTESKTDSYNDAKSATEGHMAMCQKVALGEVNDSVSA